MGFGQRIAEGNGTCIYQLGVADDGELIGLTLNDLEQSITTLRRMCASAAAELCQVRRHTVEDTPCAGQKYRRAGVIKWRGTRYVAECVIRKLVSGQTKGGEAFQDVRLAVIGAADAGKSTLLGVLTQGELDNARGKARQSLLRHPHELATGRTSSLSHEILGFGPDGIINDYSSARTWENIVEQSVKVVEFMDTCGHPRFLRTTISALSGRRPDYACFVLPAARKRPLDESDKEILELCRLFQVPVFIIVSKIDAASVQDIDQTLALLPELVNQTVRRVTEPSEMGVVVQDFIGNRSIPVFCMSSVTGVGLDLVTEFLRAVPKPSNTDMGSEGFVFMVEDTFNPPDVGTVVSGIVSRGRLALRDEIERETALSLWLGPSGANGDFIRVKVTSIHRQRVPVGSVKGGDAASFAIEVADSSTDKPVSTSLPTSRTGRLHDSEEAALRKKSQRERKKDQDRRIAESSLFGPDSESDDELPFSQGDDVAASTPAMFSFDTDSDDYFPSVPDTWRYIDSPTSEWSESVSADRPNHNKRALGTLINNEDTPRALVQLRPRKGQVILAYPQGLAPPKAFREFEAEIEVLSLPALSAAHSLSSSSNSQIMHIGLGVGSSGVVYIGSVRQTAAVVEVHPEFVDHRGKVSAGAHAPMPPVLADRMLYLGEKGVVRLRFANEPEWFSVGAMIVFRHGKTLARGEVIQVIN